MAERLPALLIREVGDTIRMVAPYDRDCVSDLREIPYKAKRFEHDTKHWFISDDYDDLLEEIVSRYFTVIWLISEAESNARVRQARASSQRQHSSSGAQSSAGGGSHTSNECKREVARIWKEEATLFVFPGAPWPVVQAAYRALAKLWHPDHNNGAGHERMVEVNRAYAVLEKRVAH